MLLNVILLLVIVLFIGLLITQIKTANLNKFFLPLCSFIITEPEYYINDNIKSARFSVITKTGDRYFKDFPLGFRFYSTEKFKSKIKISYTELDDNDVETIYDRIIEFEDSVKEHIYYMNDVIIGTINIEIYTSSQYGTPSILFEILQGNMCHMEYDHKLEINFPKNS